MKTDPCFTYTSVYGPAAGNLSFCDGVDAFERGDAIEKNPYSETDDAVEYPVWVAGYAAAAAATRSTVKVPC